MRARATSLSLCKFNQSVIKFNLKRFEAGNVSKARKKERLVSKKIIERRKKKEEIIASSFEIRERGALLINFSGMQKATSFLLWSPPQQIPFLFMTSAAALDILRDMHFSSFCIKKLFPLASCSLCSALTHSSVGLCNLDDFSKLISIFWFL
jgi:hypothetical protein